MTVVGNSGCISTTRTLVVVVGVAGVVGGGEVVVVVVVVVTVMSWSMGVAVTGTEGKTLVEVVYGID